MTASPSVPRGAEAAVTAGVGAVIAGLAGSPFGIGRVLASVAALNGLVSGWRGIYAWRTRAGVVAFVLDSTWASLTTAGSLISHLIAAARRTPGYDATLSHRLNRHVYQRGFQPRRHFVITVGNVISGAGDTSVPRRRHLVDIHENAHVWQARLLGPTYPVLYGTWAGLGALAGAVVWAFRLRNRRFGAVVETFSYYLNPLEWWAYSREGNWPPAPMQQDLAWRKPMARPLVRAPR